MVCFTSWIFSLKKKKDGGEKFPFHFQTFDHSRVCGRFLQDFERNLNISSGSRDISSRNSRTDTSPTSAFVLFLRFEKKKEKGKEKGKRNREEKKKNRSLCDILADLYHVSLKNSRVSSKFTSKVLFYSIYFFSFHPKLKNRTKFAKKQL